MTAKGTFGKGTLLRRQFPQDVVLWGVSESGPSTMVWVLDADSGKFSAGDLVHYWHASASGFGSPTYNVVESVEPWAGIYDKVNFVYPHGAHIQIGTKLWYYDYETVANVTSITGPSPTSDQLDITSHNSTSRFRESVPGGGLLETGELQITANYDPAHVGASPADNDLGYPSRNDINSIVDEMDWPIDLAFGGYNGRIAPVWEIKFATTSVRFHGRVSAATFGSPIDGVHTVDLTIKVDGEITWPS